MSGLGPAEGELGEGLGTVADYQHESESGLLYI